MQDAAICTVVETRIPFWEYACLIRSVVTYACLGLVQHRVNQKLPKWVHEENEGRVSKMSSGTEIDT